MVDTFSEKSELRSMIFNKNFFSDPLWIIGFAFLFISTSLFSQNQNIEDRRDPSSLGSDRIPGYELSEEDSPSSTGTSQNPPKDNSKKSEEKPVKTDPILTKTRGFSEDGRFVEIRGGASFFIGGPVVDGLNKNIRTFGFDTDYTYSFGNDIQRGFLYNQTQNYSGANVEGIRMGLLYEKAFSEHWSLGGGVDYREYRFGNIPNNILARSFIVGSQRFLQNPTAEEIERNIGLEIAGSGNRSQNIIGSKIVFLEVNASYHFFPENAWDPYLRPIFGLGYDTVSETYAVKLGGGAGIRYYFANGIYLGGELTADIVYLAQNRVVRSQARDRIHELTYNIFVGKKFD